MSYLLDTNIVLRFVDETSAEHSLVQQAVTRLRAKGERIFLAPQVIIEFWAVATRPRAANGFNWIVEKAHEEVIGLLRLFPLLPDTPAIFTHWLGLVTKHKVSGKQVHDARLAATAKAHEVENLLTLNIDDFKRFDLNAVHPSELVKE